MCNYNDDCGGWLTGVLCVVFLGFFLLALYHIAIEPQVLSNSQIEGAEFSKRRLVGREMSKMGKKQRKKNKNGNFLCKTLNEKRRPAPTPRAKTKKKVMFA